jgi:hypothetical protein
MIIKPNKELKPKVKYEDVEVTYFYKTSKVTLTNKHKLSKTLKEIRWITKNMMNLSSSSVLLFIFRGGRIQDT